MSERTADNCAYPHDRESAHDHADCEDTLSEDAMGQPKQTGITRMYAGPDQLGQVWHLRYRKNTRPCEACGQPMTIHAWADLDKNGFVVYCNVASLWPVEKLAAHLVSLFA